MRLTCQGTSQPWKLWWTTPSPHPGCRISWSQAGTSVPWRLCHIVPCENQASWNSQFDTFYLSATFISQDIGCRIHLDQKIFKIPKNSNKSYLGGEENPYPGMEGTTTSKTKLDDSFPLVSMGIIARFFIFPPGQFLLKSLTSVQQGRFKAGIYLCIWDLTQAQIFG